MKLSSTTKNRLALLYFLAAAAYVLFWLADRSIGFTEIILLTLYACFVVWIWRQPSPARPLASSRYEVEVCQPDNNPIHFIERK